MKTVEPTAPGPDRPRSRFRLAIFYALSLFAGYSALRVVLFLKFKPDALGVTDALRIFLTGVHLDALAAVVLTLPLVVWLTWVCNRRFFTAWHRVILRTALFFAWALQTFLLFTEFYFFDEFKSRFNTVAVDYLLYPYEVFVNIWQSYPLLTVVGSCLLAALAWSWLSGRICRGIWTTPVTGRARWQFLGGALALAAVLVVTYSPGELRFSRERVANELANNGAVAFVNAAWTRHLDYPAFYRTLPPAEARALARQLLAEPNAQFASDTNSLQRLVAGSPERPRYNVVIFLQESFGSEFWGSLGAQPTWTPEMDRLAATEGLLFTNIYASGNRTVRGFEGVLASFPPLPGDAIVKRDRSENVETIARVLQRDGYETVFLYGGRGIFDGMRSFTTDNGYDRFIEQKHFANPTFTTAWGVCDEDLFQRTLEELRAMSQRGKPFLATVLSVSNHQPFKYPLGRIPEVPDKRRVCAVKYTDWALGQFFQAAKKELFYQNTIFVVVADHGARVYGSQSIPIHSYEIPLMILGPAVVKGPGRAGQLGCSLDVAPTILGMLGRPYHSLFFGRDLLHSPPEGGRVLINHNRDIGIFRGERMVIFGINKTIEYYRGNPRNDTLRRVKQLEPADLALEKEGTALFQMADELYMQRRYRVQLPEPAGSAAR